MSNLLARTRESFLVFGAPLIGEAEKEEVLRTLEGGWIGTGPKVAQFQRAFAEYKGAPHVAALSSCTAALHLSLKVAGIKPGDEVITTPMTFCSTVNAIIHAGGTPVLADVDPNTMNLDPVAVRERLSPRTRAIVPVHFAGRPCDMDGLRAVLGNTDVKIIEDCAHAIETEYHGRKAGTIGDFGCFSFYTTKNVVTAEGGMVIATNSEDIDRVKVLALHGMSKDAWARYSDSGFKHYRVVECGFKYNMTDLAASLGIHQLRQVETNWQRRRELWQCYNEAFAALPVQLPAKLEPDTRHAYHLYTILIDDSRAGITRDDFLDGMTQQKIGAGVHYLSIPEHPYYAETFGWRPEDYPHAMRLGRQTVSLPLSAKLSDQDAADVVSGVRRVLGYD